MFRQETKSGQSRRLEVREFFLIILARHIKSKLDALNKSAKQNDSLGHGIFGIDLIRTFADIGIDLKTLVRVDENTKDRLDCSNQEFVLIPLVLHQMPSAHAALICLRALQSLSAFGQIVMADYHPAYLKSLVDQDASFHVVSRLGDRFSSTYIFNSGEAMEIHCRDIETQLDMLKDLGFDLVQLKPIQTSAVIKSETNTLSSPDADSPMFYLTQMRKNIGTILSSHEGLVAGISEVDSFWIEVKYADGQKFQIPKFTNWDTLNPGCRLITHQTHRPDTKFDVVHYWLIDELENVTGGKMFIRHQLT